MSTSAEFHEDSRTACFAANSIPFATECFHVATDGALVIYISRQTFSPDCPTCLPVFNLSVTQQGSLMAFSSIGMVV